MNANEALTRRKQSLNACAARSQRVEPGRQIAQLVAEGKCKEMCDLLDRSTDSGMIDTRSQ